MKKVQINTAVYVRHNGENPAGLRNYLFRVGRTVRVLWFGTTTYHEAQKTARKYARENGIRELNLQAAV